MQYLSPPTRDSADVLYSLPRVPGDVGSQAVADDVKRFGLRSSRRLCVDDAHSYHGKQRT